MSAQLLHLNSDETARLLDLNSDATVLLSRKSTNEINTCKMYLYTKLRNVHTKRDIVTIKPDNSVFNSACSGTGRFL